METILSFGGGVQTTALAVLVAQGDVKIDRAIFADTGAEKPETYYYIDAYIKPLFNELRIPFETIPGQEAGLFLTEYCLKYRIIPSVVKRWCSDKFKVRPINRRLKGDYQTIIGFSADEVHRAERAVHKGKNKLFPLIDRGLTTADCSRIIQAYGWPVPLRSSCYFCPFQKRAEWNWLKIRHPELIEKARQLEDKFHGRRPDLRDDSGLLSGKPLWKWDQGLQMELPILAESSCWSGDCNH